MAILLASVQRNCAQSLSLGEPLLTQEPSTVADPLDFSGFGSMRLPALSQRALSWTDVRFTLNGVNATDPYQPGRMIVFPDMQAVQDVVVRQGSDISVSPTYGSEIAILLRDPGHGWHGNVSSSGTGSFLASGNLPSAATRGSVLQTEQFNWFTRDHAEIFAPLGARADALLAITGQWASQSVPDAAPGQNLNSRLLFSNAWGRYQIDKNNQIHAAFSGSQIHLSNWGVPAGIEAMAGWWMMPNLVTPTGFSGLREADDFRHVEVGWSRSMLSAQYGFTSARLTTTPSAAPDAPSRIDLGTGDVAGAPPLANQATRARQSLQGAFTPRELKFAGATHSIAVGVGWDLANIRNRFSVPFDSTVITVNGVPAYTLQWNTPTDNRERVQNVSFYVGDKIAITPWLTASLALLGDLARGSLPGGPTLIAWNSVSPRAGLALSPPGLRRMTLRGGYARLFSPLAGRYLDFGDLNSLGGAAFEGGQLLSRYGGPYSRIDSHLQRPYADEFNLGAGVSLPFESSASIRFFRRDEKNRIAATNIGVPASAYQPVQILDPGPDSLPGTFDDQTLIVYAQNPASLGKDVYLLTNPRGLRMLNEGLLAEAGGRWRTLQTHASFMAVKSYGPTNPGNSVLANDAGVIGALLANPNSDIHAAGRTYFDRAYVGKIQLTARLPKMLGGVEWANTAVYLDGLPFARQLLVTGLPQGPLLVATTVRGSPEGGNRAEYVLNWNSRLSRAFGAPHGRVRCALDILNVINAANRTQENDLSGPLFNQRLPVAILPARFLRLGIDYQF